MAGYYKTIKGKKYDAHLLSLADESVAGRGDGRISLRDAKKILTAVRDTGAYTDIEKKTIHYIRDHYDFTDESDAWFRTEIHKWAASKKVKAAPVKKEEKQKKSPVKKPPRPKTEKAVLTRDDDNYLVRQETPVPARRKRGPSSKAGWFLASILIIIVVLLIVFFPKIQSLLRSGSEEDSKSSTAQFTPASEKLPEKELKQIAPVEAPSETAPKFQSYKAEGKEGYDYYTVRQKETLVSISVQLTGKYWNCKTLYEENKGIIRDANIIFNGQIIKIPDSMKKDISRRRERKSE